MGMGGDWKLSRNAAVPGKVWYGMILNLLIRAWSRANRRRGRTDEGAKNGLETEGA